MSERARVHAQGDGLSGPAALTLAPRERASYELQFAPLRQGTQRGQLSFCSELVTRPASLGCRSISVHARFLSR